MFACCYVDGRERVIEEGVLFFGVEDATAAAAVVVRNRTGDEFFCGENVRVCDVADVGPVE